MPTTQADRATAMLLALLAWFTLALRLYLSIANALAKDLDLAPVLIGYCSFFTILSNLLVACVCTWIAFAPDRSNSNLEAAAVYIAVVGLGYTLLLHHTWDPQGPEKVADVLLHDLIPLFYVLYWFFFRRKRKPLPWSSTLVWLIWPAIYLIYSMIRGARIGTYSYPFLDPGNLGYSHVLIMVLVLIAAFVILGVTTITLTRRRSTTNF
jgi:hypothetical protein